MRQAEIVGWYAGETEEQKASERIAELVQGGYRVETSGTGGAGGFMVYAWVLMVKAADDAALKGDDHE